MCRERSQPLGISAEYSSPFQIEVGREEKQRKVEMKESGEKYRH